MKFMQRAMASASSAGSSDSDVPSSKKRKLDQSLAPGRIDPNINQALIQAALHDQEAARQAALAKHSAADTHWVLKMKVDEAQSQKESRPLNVVYVGYGEIDSDDDNNEDSPAKGRTSTKPPKQDGVVSLGISMPVAKKMRMQITNRLKRRQREKKHLVHTTNPVLALKTMVMASASARTDLPMPIRTHSMVSVDRAHILGQGTIKN